MAVPTVITDLSVTAGSNSPLGTEVITTTVGPDEYVRMLSAIIRREQAQATAVASGTTPGTVDLGAIATGNYVHVTGTTTITSFGTIGAGVERTVVFDGILSLTYNATSLILPGAVSITTAAGDAAVFRSEGSGNWKCIAYENASGLPVVTILAGAGLTKTGNTIDAVGVSGRITISADTIDIGSSVVTLTDTQTLTNKTVNLTSNTLVATSAQILAAVTDETGTGALVFAGSPTFTGAPLAPTASVDTNTTQLATTAMVIGQASATNPLMNSTVAIGTSTRYSREDHVHASDTAKANLASPTFTGTVTIPLTPSNTTDAASKGYVDSLKQALDIKDSVRVASTANIAVASALINASVIDGVTVATGDRVLLKDQTTGSENGIYVVVASGAASRSADADASSEVTSGLYTFVSAGTASASMGFVLTTADPITLATTSLTFTQFSGAGQITAGAGLTKTGNTIDAVGTSGRIVVNANDIDIGTDVVTLTGTQTLTGKTFNLTSNTLVATSAQLIAAVTDETGTGSLVFGTSPALTTPAITGLSTGSGVATANTASTLVARDASGNFAAGTITAALTGSISGNAATVTTNANLTGGVTSSGNAATVITNANLTGPITSVGNATAIAAQTGTGTTFAMQVSPTFTGTVTVPTPSNPTDASTKAYVDAISQTLADIKNSVRVASTANITIASALTNGSTIDGTVVATGDRVLLKDQTAPAENGIYDVVASGGASRSGDADISAEVTAGMYAFVSEGTTNGDIGYVLTTNDPITLGTTSLTFTQFASAGEINAGAGLTKTGQTIDVIGTANRIVVSANAVDIGTDVLVTGGALGTPSSGTATNLTGLPAAGVVGTAAILGANTFTAKQTMTAVAWLGLGRY